MVWNITRNECIPKVNYGLATLSTAFKVHWKVQIDSSQFKNKHWTKFGKLLLQPTKLSLSNLNSAQCSEWVCKQNFFWDGFFDFNVSFWMCIMRIYSLKLPICHENIVKMVLNPVHLEHFSKNCLTLWVFTTVTCNFLVQ